MAGAYGGFEKPIISKVTYLVVAVVVGYGDTSHGAY